MQGQVSTQCSKNWKRVISHSIYRFVGVEGRMKIVVGLIEHLGDIVACEPVARYLKINHPDSQITWVVSAPFRELVECNPFIDEVAIVECLTDWMKLSKHGSFDKVIDLHVNFRICQHCQIPLVKTTGNPFVSAFEWFDYGALLEAFSVGAGLPRLSAQPAVYIQPHHTAAVDALGLPRGYCVIHRESNVAQKDWTAEGWQEIASVLRQLNIPIVEIGAGATKPSSLGNKVIDLFNKIPILQTAEVLRRARFFLGVDSGPAHLANASKTPGIILLGRHGSFRKYSPFTGYYASSAPSVKIVRNLVGDVRDLTLNEVSEAVRYVAAVTDRSDSLRNQPDVIPATPAVRPEELEQAKHYRDLVNKSGYFDAGWYAVHYADYSRTNLDALDHFLIFGARQRKSPGARFDTEWYLDANRDVADNGINPLVHYLWNGLTEGRRPLGPTVEHDVLAKLRNDDRDGTLSIVSSDVTPVPGNPEFDFPRTFAFYLPQFHPIPENDWAHGLGFSEWHNVAKAQPLFKGHHQPRLPGELGFYDLRAKEVLHDQVRLAKEHGISGFCFYYYYFKGKKLLFDPVRNFIESDINAPFMFLWANENWSKRWDGGDKEVIIAQEHSKEDDLLFIRELVQIFRDSRYVKVGGKPVLLVYKVHLFEDAKATIELWRTEIEKHGFPGIYLVMVDDWTSNIGHPRDHGFDASYEIPSNLVPEEVVVDDIDSMGLPIDFNGRIVDYAKFANFHLSRPFPKYKRFRTVMAPWDNTARYGKRAMIHTNGEGDDYKKWLLQALLDTHRRYEPDERFVFLHSWNEWCEGTYLEPDSKRGRALLRQTRDVINIARQAISIGRASPDIEVVANMLNVVDAKEAGSFQLVEAAKTQTAYVWRELEFQRGLVSELQLKIGNTNPDADAQQRILELSALETSYIKLQATDGERQSQLSALEADYIKLQATDGERQSQLSALEADYIKLQATDGERQSQLSALEADYIKLQATDGERQSLMASLMTQLQELTADKKAVYASTSWRITKPLRYLARFLKGGS